MTINIGDFAEVVGTYPIHGNKRGTIVDIDNNTGNVSLKFVHDGNIISIPINSINIVSKNKAFMDFVDNLKSNATDFSLIANEVQPQSVHPNNDEIINIKYINLVKILTEAYMDGYKHCMDDTTRTFIKAGIIPPNYKI